MKDDSTGSQTRALPSSGRRLGIDPDDLFDHFRLIIAHTPEQKERAFSLRHAVFHEELHYEIGDKTNSPIEKDKYDHNSILCLLQHKASHVDAGCLRVVIIDKNRDHPIQNLPLEEYSGNSLEGSELHPQFFPESQLCEVSRLAVHPLFRKKELPPIGARDKDISNIGTEGSENQPALISLSLFLAATAIVGLSGRRHVFAMIEPRFNRLLKVSGLHFHRAGETIDHCGLRAAYYIDQHQAEIDLPEKIMPLYARIKRCLEQQMRQQESAHSVSQEV
ncbi:Autoinducer synthetase [Halomonas sp. THAF5a]|uniref:PEP-CTERM/exosortase system-associated acyltransferase n=1 Tax=Halomonas sp. THAF5a TaxID=2587844 RepID=UPI001268BF87|nr:PEP-CTERM/exosortase system-associated acyltransferase [Halomonas sp. THAF5a]QFU02922.1 Autoinducer synthetase [Halomonas sp. THAF5a]